MNLEGRAQKDIWNPDRIDLPLEDSSDRDYPKCLGSLEGGLRVSELGGCRNGKQIYPNAVNGAVDTAPSRGRANPPPRIPKPSRVGRAGKKVKQFCARQKATWNMDASEYRAIFCDRYSFVQISRSQTSDFNRLCTIPRWWISKEGHKRTFEILTELTYRWKTPATETTRSVSARWRVGWELVS